MKRMKWLALLLAVCLLFGNIGIWENAASAEEQALLRASASETKVYTHNGRVTMIDGPTVDTPVHGFEDAAAVIGAVLPQLGGTEQTQLTPWRDLTDAFGNRYYVFQQMYNHTTVLGGAVKVITNSAGEMLGLTASLEPNPSEEAAGESITGERAQEIVLAQAAKVKEQVLEVVAGRTEQMILPITVEIDPNETDEEGSRYVWVVYTDNPNNGQARSSDLPYLAHYVTMDGEYLYSLPTMIPGDEAGASGFDASYVFEFMEPADYTGYVDLSNGKEMEISVTVMRDQRTGMYYLGNLERRIVVANCWDFLYDGGRVVLEYSPDNLEWDQTGLFTLYNYCRAYDYYKAIGWIGGDGLGTPILVLNNYCDKNRKPVNNACYAGHYLGWQIFLASNGNDFSQCLDVLGHEFTHCVTGSAMTYNAYMNDYGAINEAMSDIQGKTCQMLTEGAENTSWVMGDHSTMPVRDMAEPHRFSQPEFTWDVYYVPNVKTPTTLNDRGGVHGNSSLLNDLAWRLYEKGGMTLEEGRAFWFTVVCAMAPGTDYPQMAELLPWALRAAGLTQYETELQMALDATRLGVESIPDTFDADRALLTLRLPENEIYSDDQWIMTVYTVNTDRLVENVMGLVNSLISGDISMLPESIQQQVAELNAESQKDLAEKKGFWETFLEEFAKELQKMNQPALADAREEAERQALEEKEQIRRELKAWVMEQLQGVFYTSSTNAGQDGQTMRIVGIPGYTVPILMHGIYNDETSALDDNGILLFLGGQWIDLNALGNLMESSETNSQDIPPEVDAVVNQFIAGISNIESLDDVLSLIFYRIEGGTANELPTANLAEMQPVLTTVSANQEDAEFPAPRKSRPKTEN